MQSHEEDEGDGKEEGGGEWAEEEENGLLFEAEPAANEEHEEKQGDNCLHANRATPITGHKEEIPTSSGVRSVVNISSIKTPKLTTGKRKMLSRADDALNRLYRFCCSKPRGRMRE